MSDPVGLINGAMPRSVEFDIFRLHCIIRSLTHLDVSGNKGNAEFAKHIADGIEECKSLTHLDVSNNIGVRSRDGPAFAKHIADGITGCK